VNTHVDCRASQGSARNDYLWIAAPARGAASQETTRRGHCGEPKPRAKRGGSEAISIISRGCRASQGSARNDYIWIAASGSRPPRNDGSALFIPSITPFPTGVRGSQ